MSIYFYYVMSMMLPLFVLLVPKYILTEIVVRSCREIEKTTFGQKLLCALPLYNTYRIKKEFEGRAPIIATLNIIIVIALIFRVVVLFLPAGDMQTLLLFISSVAMLISLAMVFLMEIYINIYVARLVNAKILMLIFAFVPYLGAYWISADVESFFEDHRDRINDTFKEGEVSELTD